MQSNNPVFRRSEEFNRAGGQPQSTQTYAGYGQPSQWSTGQPGGPLGYDATRQAPTGPVG